MYVELHGSVNAWPCCGCHVVEVRGFSALCGACVILPGYPHGNSDLMLSGCFLGCSLVSRMSAMDTSCFEPGWDIIL